MRIQKSSKRKQKLYEKFLIKRNEKKKENFTEVFLNPLNERLKGIIIGVNH